MPILNVSLSDDLSEYVDRRVAEGGFASTSEFVRALIRSDRDWQALREQLVAGAESPVGANADDGFFEDLRSFAESDARTGLSGCVPSRNAT